MLPSLRTLDVPSKTDRVFLSFCISFCNRYSIFNYTFNTEVETSIQKDPVSVIYVKDMVLLFHDEMFTCRESRMFT